MAIEIVTVPCRKDNYAYLVRDRATNQTALIDAPEVEPILAALDRQGWQLDEIWITHHHDDHISGVDALREHFGARVTGNAKDRERLPRLDREVKDGEHIQLGEAEARVIDVSGHTIGHIAFVFDRENAAFTADSLMALGCGRVNEGTHAMMWESLSKYLAMPDEMRIYSGHNYGQANGEFALSIEPDNQALKDRIARIVEADGKSAPIVPSTMAEEKATNPFLRATDPDVKRAIGLEGADDASTFAEIRRRKDVF